MANVLRKKHILIITDKQVISDGSLFFSKGGTSSELNALADCFRVSFLAPVRTSHKISTENLDQINGSVAVYDLGRIWYPRGLPALNIVPVVKTATKKFCHSLKPDVVIGKCPRETGMLGVVYAAGLGLPTILHYSYDWFDNVTQKYLRCKGDVVGYCYGSFLRFARNIFLKNAVTKAESVATVSRDFASRLALRYGLCEDDICIMRNTFSQSSRFEAIPPIEPATSAPMILYVGRMDLNKNIEKLLLAASDLKKQQVPFLLSLVGDGEDRLRLQKLARTLCLTDRVHFKGWISNRLVASYLKSCRCLALISMSEGLGQVIIEALSSARPVIASNVGGIPELVKDGETGYLVSPNNVTEITHALKTLLLDADKAREMGLKGRHHIEQNFSVQSTLVQWSDAVERVLKL